MAFELKNQHSYPLAPIGVTLRSDAESANPNFNSNNNLKKKRRIKCLILLLLLSAIILFLVIAFSRIKTPKIRLNNIRVTTDTGDNNNNNNIRYFAAQVLVRNNNYGRYEFDSSLGTITSGDVTIGQFVIPEGSARFGSTKEIFVVADINLGSRQSDDSTVTSGVVPVTCQATLYGKVKLLKVFRRKRSAKLSCTMSINLALSVVQDLNCE